MDIWDWGNEGGSGQSSRDYELGFADAIISAISVINDMAVPGETSDEAVAALREAAARISRLI